MRRAKQRFKKGMAIILTLVMMVGLVPVMPGSIEKVQAAGGNTPSVTAYATREELMTKFDLDGEDDIVGTICFGIGHRQWYIAGRDSSVKGDNIILFAKESMDDYKFMDVASENVMNNIIISDIPVMQAFC